MADIMAFHYVLGQHAVQDQAGAAHDAGEEVVAQAVRGLGERVGRQRREHEAVGPAPQLNVQHLVAHALPLAPLCLVACRT